MAIDICGPFPSGEYIIVLVDYYSKWPEAKITSDISAQKIVQWLDSIFIGKGYSDCINSDKGCQFISSVDKEYLASIGVQPRYVTPYWPQANGLVERLNQVFLKAFNAAIIDGKVWKDVLGPFLLAYLTTPHVTTDKTPACLLFGHEFKTKLTSGNDYVNENVQTRKIVNNAQHRLKLYSDQQRAATPNTLKIGDKVLLKRLIYRNKLESTFVPHPATILKIQGGHLKVRTHDNIIVSRNVHLAKRVNMRNDASNLAPVISTTLPRGVMTLMDRS